MTKIILFTVFIFASFQTLAAGDFSGHWQGIGHADSTSLVGISGDCTIIDLMITKTDTGIVIDKYTYDCGSVASKWGPVKMDFVDGKVIEDNGPTGTVTEDTLHTAEQDGAVIYNFNIKLMPQADGTIALQTHYGTQNFVGKIDIKGLLKKVQ